MQIGEQVLWKRRLYVFLGVDPMSVRGRKADLEDIETRERLRLPYDQIETAPQRPSKPREGS